MMRNSTKQLGEVHGPLLLFGGPYSNLQATLAIREVAAKLEIPCGNIICTGDLVAYCGEPRETLDLIRDWGIHVVKGNCEESLASDAADCGCGFDEGTTCSLLAADWYRFARQQIDAGQKEWMSSLPTRIGMTCGGRSIAIVHGGVDQINRFIFPSTPKEVKVRELDLAQTDIVIGGHSGIPCGQRLGNRAWLNAGVIGMPANDGTRDGWYLLLRPHSAGVRVSWHQLTYDAQRASAVMQEQGLCSGYHRTLLDGLWPSMEVLPDIERSRQGQRFHLEALSL